MADGAEATSARETWLAVQVAQLVIYVGPPLFALLATCTARCRCVYRRIERLGTAVSLGAVAALAMRIWLDGIPTDSAALDRLTMWSGVLVTLALSICPRPCIMPMLATAAFSATVDVTGLFPFTSVAVSTTATGVLSLVLGYVAQRAWAVCPDEADAVASSLATAWLGVSSMAACTPDYVLGCLSGIPPVRAWTFCSAVAVRILFYAVFWHVDAELAEDGRPSVTTSAAERADEGDDAAGVCCCCCCCRSSGSVVYPYGGVV